MPHPKIPSARHAFTIPSLHDNLPLQCRIYHPATPDYTIKSTAILDADFQAETCIERTPNPRSIPAATAQDATTSTPSTRSTTTSTTNGHAAGGQRVLKAAIVAHPYAPLGGSYDDSVVLSLVTKLVSMGYVVGTFNFRYVLFANALSGPRRRRTP